MAFVEVIVIDLEGNSHRAEIDDSADRQMILNDLVEGLGLPKNESYELRTPPRITPGSILVIDKGKNRYARFLS